jgi:nucleoside-diphosphate-sugar epimerase
VSAGTPPVLVTGAHGFIGRHLVRALIDRGMPLRILSRRSGSAHPGIDVRTVPDIAAADWRPLLEGCDAVVHLAAVAHRGAPASPEEARHVRAVNVEAVGALARAAAQAGVRRLVLLSSIGVLGGSGVFSAYSPPAPHDFYSQTKLDGEDAARAAAGALELSVVRVPLVYGPDAPGNFGQLLRVVRSGLPLPLGAVRNRRSLLAVWNLCDLLITCLAHPQAVGTPLLGADDGTVSTAQLIRTCAESLGVRPRLWPAPVPLLRAAARLAGRRADFVRLCADLVVDDRDTRMRLGWKPPLAQRTALARACRESAGPANG